MLTKLAVSQVDAVYRRDPNIRSHGLHTHQAERSGVKQFMGHVLLQNKMSGSRLGRYALCQYPVSRVLGAMSFTFALYVAFSLKVPL